MSTTLPNVNGADRDELLKELAGEQLSLFRYTDSMAIMVDAAPAMALAIDDLVSVGGGRLYLPGGYTYIFQSRIEIPVGAPPITIYGDGVGTIIKRGASIAVGHGLIDIHASNSRLTDVLIEGDTTTPVALDASAFSGDPLHNLLTLNTSIWIHDGIQNIRLERVAFRHTGGYAVLANAVSADIKDLWFEDLDLENCYPNIIGYSGGPKLYGSINSGILLHGNGLGGNPYMVRGARIIRPKFKRIIGTGIWTHLYGFDSMHENLSVINPYGRDIGRDLVQFGGVSGGVISDVDGRRIGYVVTDDVSAATPRWINPEWGVGIDFSGKNLSIEVTGGELVSCNGGYIDADGLSNASITGVTCRTPRSTDEEYTDDGIGTIGWGGSVIANKDFAYGFQSGNTSNLEGGENIEVSGCSFINLSGGALKGYALRRGHLTGNTIESPAAPAVQPIVLGTVGTGTKQRAYDSVVSGNRIHYSPASPLPCIFEDSSLGAFDAADRNWVFGNTVISNGNAYEFQKDPVTNSTTEYIFSSHLGGLTAGSFHAVRREGQASASSSALRFYHAESGLSNELHMQLQGYRAASVREPLLNVSKAGASGTGAFATGNRTTGVFGDAILTGKGYLDSLLALTDTTYADADADLLNAVVGGGATGVAVVAMQRYKGSVGYIEQSIAISAGHRVWAALGGGSSYWAASGSDIVNTNTGGRVFVTGTSSGNDYILKLNDASSSPGVNLYSGATKNASWAAGATSAFTVRDSADTVRFLVQQTGNILIARTTDDSSGAVLQIVGFVNATTGYATTSAASNAVNVASGGVTALSLISIRNDGVSGVTISRTSATANTWGLGVSSSGHLQLNDDTAGSVRLTVNKTSGLITIGSTVAIDQSGNITMSAVLACNGAAGGVNASSNTNYNTIQVSSNGGMLARNFTATAYIQMGQNSGVPTIDSTHSTGDTLNNGAMYYDTSASKAKLKVAGSFVNIATEPGAWTSYTPSTSYTAGTITVSSSDCKWTSLGKNIYVRVHIIFTLSASGTSASLVKVTLPATAASNGQTLATAMWTSSTFPANANLSVGVINNSGTELWVASEFVSFSNAFGYDLVFSGVYEGA